MINQSKKFSYVIQTGGKHFIYCIAAIAGEYFA